MHLTPSIRPSPVSSLQFQLNRAFDHFRGHPFGHPFGGPKPLLPPVSVCENDKELIVTAELPGIRPLDLDISVEGNVLTLRGEKKPDKTDDKASYQAERAFGPFLRRIELPTPVDSARVDATSENGVLTLKLPKLPAAKTKAIKILAK